MWCATAPTSLKKRGVPGPGDGEDSEAKQKGPQLETAMLEITIKKIAGLLQVRGASSVTALAVC